MIIGSHVLFYTEGPEADRAFFRDVLSFPFLDVGGGWLIFRLPSAEAALHPGKGPTTLAHAGRPLLGAVLYLMCNDLRAMMETLHAKKVECSPVYEEEWGIATTFVLPSGGEIGLYQPKHPTAFDLEAP